MAYDTKLADRVRAHLAGFPDLSIEEKTMFGGLAFIVNGKMCVNISGERLMCRFDPALQEVLAEKTGFQSMVMRGKNLEGYCYVSPEGFNSQKDFNNWIELCLNFNDEAKPSEKKKKI